jgi:hypothetical protein
MKNYRVMDPGSGTLRVGTANLVQAPVNERHVAERRLKARARLEVLRACQRVINQIGMVFPPFNRAAEELLNRGVWNLNNGWRM